MERGKNPAFAVVPQKVDFFVAVMGNTTSAPTIPADGTMTAAAAGLFPTAANGVSTVTAEAPTRTSAGIFTVTYQHQLVHVVGGSACVLSDGAAPTTALYAIITKIVPATRVVTFRVYTPNGTLTDPGTSDLVVLMLHGIDSTLK